MKLKIFAILMLGAILLSSCAEKKQEEYKTVKVTKGAIKAEIPSTGIVQPRNRLEVKPPIAGRIDEVLVSEGQRVKKGQILAWMSSSDRAALLDAARAKGAAEVKRWEDVYKPTPIVAPLNGFIIQRAVEPGQSVSAADAVLVMADYLIVKAQVDETDIGRIKNGQLVNIVLDAYQGAEIDGVVEHIAYESQVISNVTIYEVDILPKKVPAFFRSGMSATVNFVQEEKSNILIVPLRAVKKMGDRSYVFMQKDPNKKPESLQIKTGLANTTNIEVVSGLAEGDDLVIPTVKMIEDFNKQFERRRGPTNPLQRRNNN
ncbi:MAG: efflux RND transporter periplasmic adaptor subunit [Candidatus Margulisbacteria bacterium]|nr:efflux RND transporter periplasmic adaptor subunit [Candidatus Margulisiibacteriota bacterium]